MSGMSDYAIKPTEIVALMAEIQAMTGCTLKYEWEVHHLGAGRTGVLITATLTGRTLSGAPVTSWQACQAWPCTTHKSVLGLMYNLGITVSQQYDAAKALATLPAGA